MARKRSGGQTEAYLNPQTGEIEYYHERHNYVVDTEEHYIKLYFAGLEYIRDMPQDCFLVLSKLMQHCTYAEYSDKHNMNYSFLIDLNTALKERIANELGYGVKSISNVITQLLDGDVLHRVSRSTYRLNPFLFGRGAWPCMVDVREHCGFRKPDPDATFKSTYDFNVAAKKRTKRLRQESQQAREEYLSQQKEAS